MGNSLGKGRRDGPLVENSGYPRLAAEFSGAYKGMLRNKADKFCHEPSTYQVRDLYYLLVGKRSQVYKQKKCCD